MAGMPKMQEHFSANAMDGGDGGNAGAFSGEAVRIPARSSLALTHIVYRYTIFHDDKVLSFQGYTTALRPSPRSSIGGNRSGCTTKTSATARCCVIGIPGNRLELLKGDRAGQYSIRINDHYAFAFAGRDRMPRMSKLWITTEVCSMSKKLPPIHPGEILREEFMRPLGLSSNALAKAINVTPARVNDIVRERRGISADTALRLARYFGTDAQSWMNLQQHYDLECAKDSLGSQLTKIERRAA
jgi:antitoxin HigA-1